MRKLVVLLIVIAFCASLPVICRADPVAQKLVWTRVAGVDHYGLQLSKSWLFDTLLVNDSTLTDTVAFVVIPGPGIYFWRVRSKATPVWGPFSQIWDFYITPPVKIADSLFAALRRLDSLTVALGALLNPGALVFRSEQIDTAGLFPPRAFMGYAGSVNTRGKVPVRWWRPR